MTPKQKKLAAALLELASTKFSRHCCNDYAKPADWTQEEWDELIRDMYVANGDPENYAADQKYSYDWWLMSYLGSLLEKEACPPMTPPVPPLTKCTCGHYSTNHISSGNPRCGVIGCKCTFFTLAQADELNRMDLAKGSILLDLDTIKTAVGSKCGCTHGDCIHDQIRKEVERHYVPAKEANDLRARVRMYEDAEAQSLEHREELNKQRLDLLAKLAKFRSLCAESNVPLDMQAVETAASGDLCKCSETDCTHSKIRKVLEPYYVSRCLLEERDAEIERFRSALDHMKRQRDDAEHADALESARADEWEQFCRQAEADADRAVTTLEMISKLAAEGARPRLERKRTPSGNKSK